MRICFTADVVVPVTAPPLVDGGVLVEGDRIAAVGPGAALAARAERVHRAGAVLLPGLVDADVACELDDARGDPRAADGWAALRPVAAGWTADRWARSARRGVQRLLRGGVTTAVDAVRRGDGVPALRRAGLAGDSLVTLEDVVAEEADEVAAAAAAALRRRVEGRRVGLAVAAEPRGDPTVAARLAAVAGTEPLRVDVPPGCPVPSRWPQAVGAARSGATIGPDAVVDADAAQALAAAGVAMLLTPLRWADQPPPLGPLAEAGVAVRLGSGASSEPDPLAAADAFARAARAQGLGRWPTPAGALPVEQAALRLVTIDGADAVARADLGRLETGARADLVAVDPPAAAHDGVVAGDASALLAGGRGRQVLTVLAGVRRARREAAEVAWAPIDRQDWRDEPAR